MNAKFAKTVITAATLAAALASGFAQAGGPRDSGSAGDTYGYNYRVGKVDAFTDGEKIGKVDPYTDGARVGRLIRTPTVPRSASTTRTPTVPAR